jgi:hypothetical protein
MDHPYAVLLRRAMFGMLTMALMVASSLESRKEEVMTDAGGSRKQDCEPASARRS